ncbi:hypothetical protein ABZ470_26390 [Streptosporangium sp. NPDC020072]|uniref:hypothetical protein n=1 Tax=Streptosporangium sp. NPDC020072 TaxID=3154788 RepID=UPI003419A960
MAEELRLTSFSGLAQAVPAGGAIWLRLPGLDDRAQHAGFARRERSRDSGFSDFANRCPSSNRLRGPGLCDLPNHTALDLDS